MTIANHPLDKSGRALLTHPAPALADDAKSPQYIGIVAGLRSLITRAAIAGQRLRGEAATEVHDPCGVPVTALKQPGRALLKTSKGDTHGQL